MRNEKECRSVLDDLELYLEDALTPERRAEVDRHLGQCDFCCRCLDKERELIRLLSALPVQKCPEEVVHSIEKFTLHRNLVQRRLHPWIYSLRWPSIAFASALCLFLSWMVMRSEKKTDARFQHAFTQEDILHARKQAKQGLTLTAQIVANAEKNTFKNILYDRIPRAVLDSIEKTVKTLKGG